MVALFTRMLMAMLIGCGVTMAGAIVVGKGRTGMSAAYQLDRQPCAIQLIDTDRPAESYALISKPPFCLRHSAWSPNRQYAALAAYPSGFLSIAVGRNGSNWGQVFDVEGVIGVQSSLVWSPDSTQLAFMNESAAVTMIGIVRMESGVPDPPRLFTIAATEPIPYSSLAWSPDGQFIAFGAYDAPRRQGGQELYILKVSNGSVQRLTTNTYRDDAPSWSPDGTELVFTSAVGSYNELYMMNVSSGERRRLTYFTNGYSPNWSPDGKAIAFESDLDYAHDLYIIGPNGFGLRRLTFEHAVSEIFPIWLR